MKKIALPKDVKRYAIFTVLKRVIPCVLLLVLFGLVLFFWGERIFNMDIKELKISCYIVTMLLPFVITGVPIKLIDSTWSGEILSVKIKETTAFNTEGNVRGVPYTKHTIYLVVKTDRGTTKKIVAKELGSKLYNGASVPSEGKIEHHTEDYCVGDRVYHFYGLKHHYVVRKNSDKIDCVICGLQNNCEDEECYNCGHTLIKM